MKSNGSDNLSVSEVAEILGVSRSTVHEFLKRGYFPNSYKLDPFRKSRVVIPRKDVDVYIARQRGQIEN